MNSYVYFIRKEDDGLIKIGFSQHVSSRIANLQSAYGTKLTLLGVVPGDRQMEICMHERFSEFRVSRREELFYPGESLLDYIEAETNTIQLASSSDPRWANGRVATSKDTQQQIREIAAAADMKQGEAIAALINYVSRGKLDTMEIGRLLRDAERPDPAES